MVLTHRVNPEVGRFSLAYFEEDFRRSVVEPRCVVNEQLELDYGAVVEDVIHILSTNSMTYSELVDDLPYYAPDSLLAENITSDSDGDDSSIGASLVGGSHRGHRPTTSVRGSKRNAENVLPEILERLTDKTSVNQRTVFRLKPEVMAYRFNRFYVHYQHAKQTLVSSSAPLASSLLAPRGSFHIILTIGKTVESLHLISC